jgi:hypothetical protein
MRKIKLHVAGWGLGMTDEFIEGRCGVVIEVPWDFQPEELDVQWDDITETQEEREKSNELR